jgi:hypothetical protein
VNTGAAPAPCGWLRRRVSRPPVSAIVTLL